MNYLNEHWLTSQSISGLVHFVSASLGLVLGLGILFLQPGSKIHKTAGYIFIPSVVILNSSALFIHQMGVLFGPFHYLIPVSLVSLFFGVRPFMFKMTGVRRIKCHIRGMVGAALGLWAAFFAELVARTPALNKFLFAFGDNVFWVATVEGFAFVLIFIVIIMKVTKHQFARLGLEHTVRREGRPNVARKEKADDNN